MPKSSAAGFVLKEFKEMIPPTLFFAVGFNLILLTTNLILNKYHVRFSSFLLATTGALIVGKSVLIAQALPFFRRMDTAPLIKPVLYKTAIFFAAVFVVRIIEKLIEFLTHGGKPAAIARGKQNPAIASPPALPNMWQRPSNGTSSWQCRFGYLRCS